MAPESAAHQLLRTITYSYDKRDTCINVVTLTVVVFSLVFVTAAGSLTLSSVFWLPFALFIAALQCIAALLTQQEGFSLVWCALAGLMLYEETRWRIFSSVGSGGLGVFVASAVLCVVALIYYCIEELFWLPAADNLPPRGLCRKALLCWHHLGTTAVHSLSIGIGAAGGALADVAPGRHVSFYVALTIGVASSLALVYVLRRARRRSSVEPAPATPHATDTTPSDEELAVANLQAQLMRTRDEISRLSYEHAKRAYARDGASAAAASIATQPSCSAAPAPAPSSDLQGSMPATTSVEHGTEDEGGLDGANAALAQLETLKKREAALVARLADRGVVWPPSVDADVMA